MTLAQIMTLALRQMDEDTADIADYDEVFRRYCNEGYHIAVVQYLKPRETMVLRTGGSGEIYIAGYGIHRIIEIRDKHDRPVWFDMSHDGEVLSTVLKNAELTAFCEVLPRPMTEATDVPKLPEEAHAALADYICYRHLSGGNLAKQSRAQHYLQMFHQTMRMLHPPASVTRMRNLYAATDIRRR